jgi:hypothetical protein
VLWRAHEKYFFAKAFYYPGKHHGNGLAISSGVMRTVLLLSMSCPMPHVENRK